MIGCNSTDDELEEWAREYAREREERLRELEAENASLRDEIRTLEAEKGGLEARIERLESELADERNYTNAW